MSKPPSHVGALIVRKNKEGYDVVLIKRALDQEKFFLPGGRIDQSEAEIKTLIRKVKGETGFELNAPLADLGKISRPGRDETGQKYVKTIRYYLFFLEDPPDKTEWVQTDAEGKTYYCFWKNLGEFKDLIHFPQEKQLAAIALRFLS